MYVHNQNCECSTCGPNPYRDRTPTQPRSLDELIDALGNVDSKFDDRYKSGHRACFDVLATALKAALHEISDGSPTERKIRKILEGRAT